MVFPGISRTPNLLRRNFRIFRLKLTLGTEKALTEVTRPQVLSLYRRWMRTLDATLPLALREISKDQVRAHFREGKEEYSIYTTINLLDAGEESLQQWLAGERDSLKNPSFVRPFHLYIPAMEKADPEPNLPFKKYTPFFAHRSRESSESSSEQSPTAAVVAAKEQMTASSKPAAAATTPKATQKAASSASPKTPKSVDRRPLEQRIKDIEIQVDRLAHGTYENEIEYLNKILELKQKQRDMMQLMVEEKRNSNYTKIDDELDELIEKWRTACQEALHALLKHAQDTPALAESLLRGNRSSSFTEDDDDDARQKKKKRKQADEEEEEEEEEDDDDEQDLTLGRLIQALGIDKKIVRYDEDEDDFES